MISHRNQRLTPCFDVDLQRRYFTLLIDKERPTLLLFHGLAQEVDGTDGEILGVEVDFVSMTGLIPVALERRFNLVYLEGVPGRKSRRDWDHGLNAWPSSISDGPADFAYIRNVLYAIGEHGKRLIPCGFSNGSIPAQYVFNAGLFCDRIVGGVFVSGGPMPEPPRTMRNGVPVVVMCETRGMKAKWLHKRWAKQTIAGYRRVGANVKEVFFDGKHRWYSEANQELAAHLGLT